MKKRLITAVFLALFAGMSIVSAEQVPQSEVTANEIEYDSGTNTVIATGNVVIKKDNGVAKADKAIYNMKTEQGQLIGNVDAVREDVTIKAAQVDIKTRNNILASGGNVVITRGGDSLNAPQVEYFDDRQFAQTRGSWAKLTQADGSVMTADYINYDMKNGKAIADGDVKINSPVRKLTAAGDRAEYTEEKNGQDSLIILTGQNAWAIQDGNKISGERLTFKTGEQEGEASGKVMMVIPPAPIPESKAKHETKENVPIKGK